MPNDGPDVSPSTGTSIATPRKPTGWAGLWTRAFESVGLLNKGSADSAATPEAGDAAQTAGVSSNALNVTRVGGLAALIVGAGAAAIAIFNVNKATDNASIVVAAYVSVGAIVAAALLTAAVIISSDIRARVAVNGQQHAPPGAHHRHQLRCGSPGQPAGGQQHPGRRAGLRADDEPGRRGREHHHQRPQHRPLPGPVGQPGHQR
jgi:hypothetical protein